MLHWHNFLIKKINIKLIKKIVQLLYIILMESLNNHVYLKVKIISFLNLFYHKKIC